MENKADWTKVSADKFTTPIERDAAVLAKMSIAEFRSLPRSRQNYLKHLAFENHKARKSN